MNTEFRAVNQSEIMFEMTISMPLADWRRLRDQLVATGSMEYPGRHITETIRQMVVQANTHWVDEKDE